MKGPSGFGAPKQRRVATQFNYSARPSFWQAVKSNSHLVIAAVGTIALLGVAGTALWLAMPAGDRQAFAQTEHPAPDAEATAEAGGKPTDQSSPTSATPAPAVVTADAVTLPAAQAQDDLASLSANDPRWSGATHKQSRTAPQATAEAQKEAVPAAVAPPPVPTPEQAASVAAYQPAQDDQATQPPKQGQDATPPAEASPAHPKPDKAATAAISADKPSTPPPAAAGQENGHILRGVTMRSAPKKGAAAIGTIPAKSAVQVISCKAWCEVVYKGKHGFIYKSFLGRD